MFRIEEDNLNQIECFFFDLDGTLLDLADNTFNLEYQKLITNYFRKRYDPDTFLIHFMSSVEALMTHKDYNKPIIDSFLDKFHELSGVDRTIFWDQLSDFYSTDFGYLQNHVNPTPISKSLIDFVKSKGKKIILATNPVFPEIATRQRVEWAGLDYDADFIFVPTVNNSTSLKPDPHYFQTLMNIVDVPAEKILMVGNDFLYDGSASQVGIKTWITDNNQSHLEYKNKFQIDYEGSLTELLEIVNSDK